MYLPDGPDSESFDRHVFHKSFVRLLAYEYATIVFDLESSGQEAAVTIYGVETNIMFNTNHACYLGFCS